VLGEKIIMPFFANGLQGIVVGFFHGVDDLQKELMKTTLMQFGQTLADTYANLRVRRLCEALTTTVHLDGLAQEILHVISPVKKIILSRERGRIGYALAREHNYWAGYRRLSEAADFERDPSTLGFTVDGPHGVAIYVEPLTDVPNFHHQFTHIRIEMCLRQCLLGVPGQKRADILSNGQIDTLHTALKEAMGEQTVSVAKLRQLYILSRVRQSWEVGRVVITNFEMKQFLEGELGKEVKAGYQVSSYAGEAEKILGGKAEVAKTRNSLTITWNAAN
jgi:hypothetical protein